MSVNIPQEILETNTILNSYKNWEKLVSKRL